MASRLQQSVFLAKAADFEPTQKRKYLIELLPISGVPTFCAGGTQWNDQGWTAP